MIPSLLRGDAGFRPRRRGPRSPGGGRSGRAGRRLNLEPLECRCCPSPAPGLAAAALDLPVDPNVGRTGRLSWAGATELYRVPVDAQGLLTAAVHATGFDTRLSLLDDQGRILIQSEATSPQHPDDRIALHLVPGTYFLLVQARSGAGAYTLETHFAQALPPFQPLSNAGGSYSVAVADLNGDRVPDLVVTGFYVGQDSIYLGTGDGTFQPPVVVSVGTNPVFVTTADVNGDGIPDIITANVSSNDVSILLGRGDGSFRPAIAIPAGLGPSSVAVGDFNGNGHLDLAVTDSKGDEVLILLGRNDGTFTPGARIRTSPYPSAVVATDFDGDGHTDLALVTIDGSDLTILQGRGDGTFVPVQRLPTGPSPTSLIAADVNRDGRIDLAITCAGDSTVRLFQNQGGWFVSTAVLSTATFPYALAAPDFNGDGRIDLAASSYGAGDLSIFLARDDGTYQPETRITVGASTTAIAAADLNRDGRMDLVSADLIGQTVAVLLGKGDGAFQSPDRPTRQSACPTVVAADVDGDGKPDLIVPNEGTGTVSILLGRGDGSFRSPIHIPIGLGPWGVALGDFDGDGRPDLAVTNFIEDTLAILLGNGDGTFRLAQKMLTGIQPTFVATADLDGDGPLDLVATNLVSNTISIFYGRGDGTFEDQVMLPVGSQPGNPVIVDLDGDGRPDIALAGSQSAVTVYLATGPRSYAPPQSLPAGPGASLIATGDFNHDGQPDLMITNTSSWGPSYVTVLLGDRDGRFRTGQTIPVGPSPFAVAVADVNGDGYLDIITGNFDTRDLSLLLGRGDGTFQPEVRIGSGTAPFTLAVADFNRDGRPDLAVTAFHSDGITVLLNRGGGTFEAPASMASATPRIATVTADFNRNGRLDLALTDPLNHAVQIQLSNGDGTFTTGATIAAGVEPTGLAVADLNGDGRPDLMVVDSGSDVVMVLLGLGNATFGSPIILPVGKSPHAIAIGDFDRDGVLDIAVADEGSDDVSILIGRGDGTFQSARRLRVGAEPVALVAVDLNGDGFTDLVTANRSSGDLTILWTLPGGVFVPQNFSYGGHAPGALAVGDFNGDGRTDLAVADKADRRIQLILSRGDRNLELALSFEVQDGPDFLIATPSERFGAGITLVAAGLDSPNVVVLCLGSGGLLMDQQVLSLGASPVGLVAGDFNGDGIVDIAAPTSTTRPIEVRLGTSRGQFLNPKDAAPLPQPAPILVDWNHDGTPDVFVLDQRGKLLLRLGRPESPGEYDEPQLIGQGLGVRFREIALIRTRYGPVLAALGQGQPKVWLFSSAQGPGLTLQVMAVPVPGTTLLVRMVSGDVHGDGWDDLVVVDRGREQVIVLCQARDGSLHENGPRLGVGAGASDVTIADLDHDGWPDLVVANTYSGDLSIFHGGPGARFGPETRLAAGLGAAVVVVEDDRLVRHSRDEPLGVTAGVFDPSGRPAIVSVQSGADRISRLNGTPDGGFANPSLATSVSTGMTPTQVVAAPLTPGGPTDLVVLNAGSQDISIVRNDGRGGLFTMPRVDAGERPAGLAVFDVDGDGCPDLVVGNDEGDLLILQGRGDGTFQPLERDGQRVRLAVGDFDGDGRTEFVLSDTSIDQLSVQYGATQTYVQGRSEGLKAPGAVAVADLNGDGNLDIILLDRGANTLLVYLGLGGNRFEPSRRYHTGTDPQSLTIADLNGDGILDLVVANEGSDDLSIALGKGQGAGWDLEAGPRIRVGAPPSSTTVADIDGDGIPDIISVSRKGDSVAVLRGTGRGFFDDRNPLILATGARPIRAFVGHFDPAPGLDLAVLDSGSSDLTYYSNFAEGVATARFIPSGGVDPIAGVMTPSDDGYDNLFIAHNGDARITFFQGSPDGLVLTATIALDPVVQPTDLVVSPGQSGSVQLYISAQVQGRVLLVTLSLGVGMPNPAPRGSDPAPLATREGSGAASLVAGSVSSGLIAVDGNPLGIGAAPLTATQPGPIAVGPAGASAAGPIAMANIAAGLQQIVNPSVASLTYALNDLIQMREIQISDILPLEDSGIETVAVLLLVPGPLTSGPAGIIGAWPGEGGPGFPPGPMAGAGLERRGERAPSPGSTPLERFLAHSERDLDGSAQEGPSVASSRFSNEGRETDARVLDPVGGPHPGLEHVPGSDLAHSEVIPLDPSNPLAASTTENGDAPGRFGWAKPLGGLLAISAVFLAWAAARKRRQPSRAKPASPPSPGIRRPHLFGLARPARSLASRAGRPDDLPHRLARSTGPCPERRPTKTSHCHRSV